MHGKKSPIKKAFGSIRKIITSKIPLPTVSLDGKVPDDDDKDNNSYDNKEKLIKECQEELQTANSKLLDMDVKLFQTTKKYEYAKQTQDEFLNTNMKNFIQDLVTENINKETIIQLLTEENNALKKILRENYNFETSALDDIDDLIKSIEVDGKVSSESDKNNK
jgi:hypothetical protein